LIAALFSPPLRAGYDADKKKRGSKVHSAVDTLGNLLVVVVTHANEQDRAQVKQLAADIQEVTNSSVEICFADQGYSGAETAEEAQREGIQLAVVKKMQGQSEFTEIYAIERDFAAKVQRAFDALIATAAPSA
jgi:transposase